MVREMTAALHPRGPESEGLAPGQNVALEHRHLSILDLSDAGHQPMVSEDGKVGMAFNRCIYNFRNTPRDLACSMKL